MTRSFFCAVPLLLATALLSARPVHLRVEYLTNPLGMDIAKPSLSWESDESARDWRQSQCQVLVASTPELLAKNKGDVWDSGKLPSSESVGFAYGGPPLRPRTRYYWNVRVWDAKGHVSNSAEAAWWETGLMQASDWSAKWIRWQNPEQAGDEAAIRWIWAAGQDAAKVSVNTEAVFRLQFDLSETPQRAALFLIARGDWKATVNGHDAGQKPHWNEFDRREIDSFLVQGQNTIEITVKTVAPAVFGPPNPAAPPPVPAGLAALVKIHKQDGTVLRIGSSDQWQARLQPTADWTPAAIVGSLHDQAFLGDPGPLPQPAGLLRKEFAIEKQVLRARAYVTALGGYHMSVNGKPVAPYVLMPGFTQFNKRVQYQTFDVTQLVTSGANVAGVVLGDGWFGSGLTWTAQHFKLLPPTRLLAQIEIEYSDGSRQTIGTDDSWKTAESPILHGEIYSGEIYDARLEKPGWDRPGFDAGQWQAATVGEAYTGEISSQIDVPAQVVAQLKPERINPLPENTYIFDMGQNMVGWVALKVRGAAGATVRLRFAEILNPDGSIYTTNLRNADATDSYTLRGGGDETFAPTFTFHGFRYVELSGFPGTPTLESITGQVVSSVNGTPTATIQTASDLVNHMWKLGIWGQRGNFLSVPTDCPQRDERLGWMADAAVFWRTGTYNFDTAAFTHKWLRDVRDSQSDSGAFSNVSPNIGLGEIEGAPGWGDAGVIVPWTAWLQYGDRNAIEQNWEAMEKWMAFIQSANPDFIRRNKVGPDFADWLAPDPTTPKPLVDTAYWALIADMMTQMAHAVHREDDAKKYADLFSNIKAAFQKEYVKPDGTVATGSQTSYVVALHMKLLPTELEAAAVDNLVKNIAAHDWHLTTGFLGTPYLLFTLGNHGRLDVAYRLLLTDTYPSWGYMIKKGATTWWERWNGDTGDPAMNSYNHYAFGSVVAWVYQNVTGIDTTSTGAGFHEITIQPHPDKLMPSARGEYQSVYGKITTDWNATEGGGFELKVTIPPNSTARVVLPASATSRVTEDGKKVKVSLDKAQAFVRIGSGSYDFRVN